MWSFCMVSASVSTNLVNFNFVSKLLHSVWFFFCASKISFTFADLHFLPQSVHCGKLLVLVRGGEPSLHWHLLSSLVIFMTFKDHLIWNCMVWKQGFQASANITVFVCYPLIYFVQNDTLGCVMIILDPSFQLFWWEKDSLFQTSDTIKKLLGSVILFFYHILASEIALCYFSPLNVTAKIPSAQLKNCPQFCLPERVLPALVCCMWQCLIVRYSQTEHCSIQ